jgi:PAS domain S-box-containing protein
MPPPTETRTPPDAGAPAAPDLRGGRARLVLGAAFDAVLIADAALVIVDVDGDPAGLLGRSAAELIGAEVATLLPPGVIDQHARRAAHQRLAGFDVRRFGGGMQALHVRHASGALVPVEATLVDLGGDPPLTAVLLRDAANLARMAEALGRSIRAERVLGAVHDAMATAEDEITLKRAVCRVLVAECGYPLAWVGIAQNDERRSVRPIAHAGMDDGYIAQADVVWSDTRGGRGPGGTAIRTERTTVAQSTDTHAGFAPWREAARARGFAGCAALPIRVDGQVVGALSVYAREVDAFPIHEVDLLEQIVERLGRACALLRARAARHRAEARLAEVLDDLGVVTWSTSAVEGRLTYLNDAAVRFFDRPRGELLALPALRDLTLPVDRPAVARAVASCQETGVTEAESRIVRPDGTTRWAHSVVRAARDEEGTLIGFDGVAVDVTARREAEEGLRALNAELEQRVAERTAELSDLYDNAPCGYHTLDADGTVVRINATELRWLGYARDEVVGRRITDFLSPESGRSNRETMGRLRGDAAESSVTNIEREFIRKDGSTYWVLVSSVLVRDAAGHLLQGRSTAVDVTERRRAEGRLREQEARVREALDEARVANEALARAARAKDEFLASMSHELRTPLNGVLGLAEAVVEGVYGPINPRQAAALKLSRESGHHLLALINDILDLAKVEAGKVTLEPAPVVVGDLVNAALRLVQEGVQRKGHRVSITQSGPFAPVLLDERRMKQVLVNLLSNAVKFTPAGGSIGVTTEAAEDGATLSFTVWDTGIGIADADAGRLFQPFVQLDSRLAREHAGTGLGLALVWRIVDLHGGSVHLESVPGQGSRFTVTLPWRVPAPEAGTAPVTPGAPGQRLAAEAGASTGLILLAEDDETNAEVIVDALSCWGYQVRTAVNGVQAVELARALRPALILMDVQMPVMDGLTAIRTLRADPSPELRGVPIIVVTALAMPGDRERCRAAGATDYLAKPVNLRRLQGMIEALWRPPLG